MRTPHLPTLALVALLGLSACQQIIGLEERDDYSLANDGDGGTDGAPNPLAKECKDSKDNCACTAYCDLVDRVCTPENKTSTYPVPDYCLALCPHFLSEEGATRGNNFQCRLASAGAAEAVMSVPSETVESCRDASPGGFGFCGSNCESYCQLYDSICGANPAQPPDRCVAMCSALRDDRTYNAKETFDNGKADSIQCRLAHLSAAAKAQMPHCGHAQIIRTDVMAPCVQPANCNDYCAFVMNTCKGDADLQYESVTDCMSVCNSGAFPLGELTDTEQNTLNCRVYHTYNALRTLGGGHCTHAGPGGNGHCGLVCPAYCDLAEKACSTSADYAKTFPGGKTDCLTNCAKLVNTDDTSLQKDYGYDVATGKKGGSTIQCRLYYTTKAFTNPTECASAVGAPTGKCVAQ